MENKYQSYFDFKYEYYKRFPASTFRFGQAFLCKFVNDTRELGKIWNEPDSKVAEDLVWKYIQDEGLDFNNLEIINDY